MIKLSNEQIQQVLNNKTETQEGLNEILTMTLNAIMHSERVAFLEGKKTKENKANGYRSIRATGYGRQLSLAIPRDRLGVFKPLLMLALKEEEEEVRSLCYELYREGLTTRRISKVFERIYKRKYGKSTISAMSQTFKEQLQAWRSRGLDKRYLVVYLDAIHVKVRRATVEGEAFYVALAVKEDYTREVIAIQNNPTESASGWGELLQSLQKRGLTHIDLVVADGIRGLEEKVLANFPKTAFQTCVTHFKRNIIQKVRSKDKPLLTAHLASLFAVSDPTHTREKAYEIANKMVVEWAKKYPMIKKLLSRENLRTYLTCMDFNFKIQSMIYTTNWVERLNKEFRRALKIRNAMPSVDSVLLLLSAVACDMEKGRYSYPVYNLNNEPSFQENSTEMSQEKK